MSSGFGRPTIRERKWTAARPAEEVSAISTLTSDGAVRSPELERLIERLGEPRTVAALNVLLDNVELLAVLVRGLDGLARKGDTISDTIAETIAEARGAGRATGLDLRTTTHQLATLIPALADAAPAITRLSQSAIVEDEAISVVGLTGTAMADAYSQAQAGDVRLGLRGLMRATRDPDVQRGLGFLVELGRVFGRSLARKTTPTA
jgi:hypothetical protein